MTDAREIAEYYAKQLSEGRINLGLAGVIEAAISKATESQLAALAAKDAEIERLKLGIQNIIDGDGHNPPRNSKCKYDKYIWEDCEQCVRDELKHLINNPGG